MTLTSRLKSAHEIIVIYKPPVLVPALVPAF